MAPSFVRHARSFGRVELECRGVVDAGTVTALRRELAGFDTAALRQLTVDLRLVTTLDAAGVAALASTAVALRRRGVEIRLLAPQDRRAGRILDYSGLVPVLAA